MKFKPTKVLFSSTLTSSSSDVDIYIYGGFDGSIGTLRRLFDWISI